MDKFWGNKSLFLSRLTGLWLVRGNSRLIFNALKPMPVLRYMFISAEMFWRSCKLVKQPESGLSFTLKEMSSSGQTKIYDVLRSSSVCDGVKEVKRTATLTLAVNRARIKFNFSISRPFKDQDPNCPYKILTSLFCRGHYRPSRRWSAPANLAFLLIHLKKLILHSCFA